MDPVRHHSRTVDTTDRVEPDGWFRIKCGHCDKPSAIMFPDGPCRGVFCRMCGGVWSADTEQKVTSEVRPPESDEWRRTKDMALRAQGWVSNAIHQHEPSTIVGAFSGGHDSLVACHVTSQHPQFDGILHVNTGIGVDETRQYVRRVCDYFGWDLYEYKAKEYVRGDGEPDPQRYEDLVKERGFPGPAMHWKMYHRLKLRPISQFVREHKDGHLDRVMMCSGRRRQESARRMKIEDRIERDGAKVWCQPILDWSGTDCTDYIDNLLLPKNKVTELLCMSGECLCGAYAKDGELAEIEACFPETADRIKQLEDEVDFPWGWEDGPPDWWTDYKDGQEFLPGMAPDDDVRPMCQSCEFKHEQHEKAKESMNLD